MVTVVSGSIIQRVTMTDLGNSFDLGLLDDIGTAYRRYKVGERIFVTGDEGDCMYVVRSGLVEIVAYGTVLAHVGPGEMFGEIAMIDGAPRAATAKVLEDCEVAPIDRSGFLKLVQRDPGFALEVMKTLAQRLRDMNESM